MSNSELQKRQAIVEHCRALNTSGLNQGTSGNISIRHGDGMLISPTSRPYDDMTAEDISFVALDGTAHGPWPPSSEWRFHRDILASRDNINAIVHAHPNYCTTLAIMGLEIPAIHYMVAVFGGPNIRCAPYRIYGSEELSKVAVLALEERYGCLLAHHGMIALGSNIKQAFWRAGELEALARKYHGCLAIGKPPVLSDEQIRRVADKMAGYGLSEP